MKRARTFLDHAAGRIYTRILAVFTGAVSLAMLVAAFISWRTTGTVGGLIWLMGAIVFGLIARASWRSRAGLSDIDFHG